MMKKMLSLTTCVLIIFCCCLPAFAAPTEPRLYSAYGDDMLFKQNEQITLAGVAKNGSVISATLINSGGETVATAEAAAADGEFVLSLSGMPGGYEAYTIALTADGAEFDTLENIVFGELWLASGQSNMMYPLGQSKDGAPMMNEGKKGSKWLRVYMEPAYPTYNGSNALIPAKAQPEIIGGHWITGESDEIYGMSAVGYYFAQKLMNELNMPIGILNSSLGGSAICSWLSREAIESNETMKKHLTEADEYIAEADWQENEIDIYNTMCANYNLRTYSYRNFRLSGMIWYQGETDLMNTRSAERYALELDLMQRSYAQLFNYEGERLPLIMTQLAAFFYYGSEFVLPERNYAFTQMQQTKPEAMAVTTLYDLPVTYIPEVGVIHPEHKTEVGERMAFAAMGLVYGKHSSYTAATPQKSETKNGSIYITLKNVGDSLKINGDKPIGFTVCGADGVHIPATAELISPDTVRVYNESIAEPLSASYAYCVSNSRANLCASIGGELTLPVSPFDTNPKVSKEYWQDAVWTDCDDVYAWHNSDADSAFYATWGSDTASLELGSDFYSGNGSLHITAETNKFDVHPITFIDEQENFDDTESDFSNYDTLSFYAKNNGKEDITFEQLKLHTYKNSFEFYSPAVYGTKDVCAVIPADGQWHKITLDLDSVYYYGNECTAAYSNDKLKYTGKMSFCFSSAADTTDLSLDCFEFTASTENTPLRFDCDISAADNAWEYICGFFTTIVGSIINLFNH